MFVFHLNIVEIKKKKSFMFVYLISIYLFIPFLMFSLFCYLGLSF